jgi:hypothetical protein
VRVLVYKVIDDATKVGLQVECIKRNVQSVGYAASIQRIRGTAAALLVIRSALQNGEQGVRAVRHLATFSRFFAMSHENSHDVIPSFE